MLGDILTWVGASLGITVLVAMAGGAAFLDYADVRGWRNAESGDSPAR